MSPGVLSHGVFIVLLAIFQADNAHAAGEAAGLQSKNIHEQTMAAGERLYRQGLLSSGNPVKGIVQEDIDIDGSMFSCASCHLRSGLGSYEGTIYTLAVSAERLFRTLSRGQDLKKKPASEIPPWFNRGDARPAYTEETLARAIRYGTDPSGRELNAAMPRYALDDRDMDILVYYLKNLSAQWSPGVDKELLRFATIITEDADPADRDSMLAALRSHIDANNGQSRHQEKRSGKGFWTEETMTRGYRRMTLDVWDLKGTPDTWQGQLDRFLREKPVFAVLGGISGSAWEPVHRFCENNKIPCFLPYTNLPVIDEGGWYTLYFSKGFHQEGETAAKYLGVLAGEKRYRVVQIYREGTGGKAAAGGFRAAWLGQRSGGNGEISDVAIPAGETVTGAYRKKIMRQYNPDVLLLWIDAKDMEQLAPVAGASGEPAVVMLSSRLYRRDIRTLPEALRDKALITWPYSSEAHLEKYRQLIRSWLKGRNIHVENEDIAAHMYVVGRLLATVQMHLKDDFYRDYFLDIMDMTSELPAPFTPYQRMTFGQGQRYASKGCYIVQVEKGPQPRILQRSEWILH